MKRRDRERVDDIEVTLTAIGSHLERGGLDDGLVFHAIRIRFIEIGEAVKGFDGALLSVAPEIPWQEIAGMRDRLTHHYFDTSRAILQATFDHDIPLPWEAVDLLRMGDGAKCGVMISTETGNQTLSRPGFTHQAHEGGGCASHVGVRRQYLSQWWTH
jgi:uncharacterized protein with HEPN domain